MECLANDRYRTQIDKGLALLFRRTPSRGPDGRSFRRWRWSPGQGQASGHIASKIQTFEDLCEEIALIRRRGYTVVDEEFELGVVSVSAPVYNFKQ